MSGGFGFGVQNTTANTGTTFSFGPNPTTTNTGISFGAPAATGTTAGFQFSSPGLTTGQTTGSLSFGTPQTTTAASAGGSFTFGRSSQPVGLSFGTQQTGTAAVPAFKPTGLVTIQQTAPLAFGSSTPQTTLSFGSTTPQTTLGFGSTTPQTTPSFGSTTPQTTLSFGSTAPQTTLSFGSAPQTTLSFGSTTAQPTISFGSTTGHPTLSFGSTTPQATGLRFAATPQTTAFATTPQATVSAFGSTVQTATVPAFSSNPQIATPTTATTTTTTVPLTFSSAPQSTLSFGPTPLSFRAPSLTQQSTPLSVGSAAQAKPIALTMGSTAFATPATTGLAFVTTQTTSASTAAPNTNLFGSPIQLSVQPATAGVSLGTTTIITTATTTTTPVTSKGGRTYTPVTKDALFTGQSKEPATKPTFPFGVVGVAPTVTTVASTSTATTSAPVTTGLFSFPTTPKTTTTTATGFTLPSSGASLFSSPFTAATTSAAVVTTTTTTVTPFKGLGGVDTTTSLPGIVGGATGRSDIKSVKENAVPNEIMQTIDTFKTFVKQQKNLACEVTRTSGKPMNKVTEDGDSLKQILTTVHSALQKNRQISNKLKADTTKCLLLCEMAQHTHDTPVGLQNENVAPLEYFLQLATKFEKDVANLRTEIDNTEKHVNSLSQPAVLTPQELSIALRRLHDSFVALAGHLQTAHAAVAIQKEKHLNLRRHFLKDNTNIFEPDDNKSSSYMKSFKTPVTLSAGPTPFSSMGGTHSISMLASQDKSGPTFPATSTTLSGWGTPSVQTGTSLLQSTGSTSLFSPQPVENQNFQLLKPPPGNKRGKR